jgi:hypothetical protein
MQPFRNDKQSDLPSVIMYIPNPMISSISITISKSKSR